MRQRSVVRDDTAGMFATVTDDVLIAGPDAHLAPTRYQDWIRPVSPVGAA